jgi:hypothetical protein
MVTLPWLEAETKETMVVMGADFWKCGVHESMREIEALTQYAHGQGLIDGKPGVEELFARPDLRDGESVIDSPRNGRLPPV